MEENRTRDGTPRGGADPREGGTPRRDAAPPEGGTPREGDVRPAGLRAFGLSLHTDEPLPGAWEPRPLAEPIVHVRSATPAEIAGSWSGAEAVGWEGTIDGSPFVVERGKAGDHRFMHGQRAMHHLSADGALLLCGPDSEGEPLRWRAILDSVLFTVALLSGREALHAGAVATPQGAVAVTAGEGGGKSTLIAELLRGGSSLGAPLPLDDSPPPRGGCSLLCDDVLVLDPRPDAAPLAHPGPPLMTVPAQIDPLPGAPGAQIASVGEERWMAVAVHPEAIPLAALVVLNRRPGLEAGLREVNDPLALLMASLLCFPRAPARERARFELAGAIAAHVPILTLDADPSVDPGALADMLRAGLLERAHV